jgi:hypothetical protein
MQRLSQIFGGVPAVRQVSDHRGSIAGRQVLLGIDQLKLAELSAIRRGAAEMKPTSARAVADARSKALGRTRART